MRDYNALKFALVVVAIVAAWAIFGMIMVSVYR